MQSLTALGGTLIVTVSNRNAPPVDKEFKVTDTTKFSFVDGDKKREMTGKDGLKAAELKEGASVVVAADKAGVAKGIQVGELPAKKRGQ